MIPDKLSILEGAIVVLGWQSCTHKGSFTRAILDALSEEYHFSLDTPFEQYPKEIQDIIIHGTGGREVKVRYKGQRGEGVYDVAFEGLINNVARCYRETFSESSKAEYETFMRITPCPTCKGQRLKKESLAVTVGDKNIYEATNMSITKFRDFLDGLTLTPMQEAIGAHILKEIRARVTFFDRCGTGLSVHVQGNRNSFRRRGSENPSGDPDWFRISGSSLYSGRTQHSPSSERQ